MSLYHACELLVLTLGHFLWEGVLIAALTAIGCRFARRAQTQYAFCSAAMLLMLLAPLVSAAVIFAMNRSEFITPVYKAPTPSQNLNFQTLFYWRPIYLFGGHRPLPKPLPPVVHTPTWHDYAPQLAAVYATGAAVMLLRLCLAFGHGRRLRRAIQPLTGPAARVLARRLADAMGVAKIPIIAASSRVKVPTVIGIFKPIILLPAAVISGLSPHDMEAILAHELAHIRRHDAIVLIAQRFIEAILFFHPAVWLVSSRLHRERENCCDDLVLSAGVSRQRYAQALLHIAELCCGNAPTAQPSLLLTISQRASLLRQRVARLLGAPVKRTTDFRSLWSASIPLLAAANAISITLLAMPHKNASAQLQTTSPATMPTTAPATTNASHTLHLTILDRKTGKPVSGLVKRKLTCSTEDMKIPLDSNGQCDVPVPDSPDYFGLRIDSPGHAIMHLDWYVPGQKIVNVPENYTTSLYPASKVGGLVVDDAGQPIAGATVNINLSAPKTGLRPEESLSVSDNHRKTDAQGRWTYEDAPPQIESARIFASHPEYLSQTSQEYIPVTELKDAQSLRDGTMKLILTRAPLIAGVVYGPDGKPLAGAQVGIGSDRVASNVIPVASTDSQGNYKLAGAPGQPITLTVTAPLCAPSLAQFAMPSTGGKTVDFHLDPAKILTGRIIDTSGNPIAGARVYIDSWRDTRTLGDSAENIVSGADGKFSWSAAPADAVVANIDAKDFARKDGVKLTAGQANEITLLRPAFIRGSVIDADTGKPIGTFKIVHGIDFKNGSAVSFQRDSYNVESQGDTLHANGKYETKLFWPYPGHVIRIEADGYLPERSPTFTIEGGDQTFDFKMHRGQSIHARVIDSDGNYRSGVTVALVTNGQPLQIQNGELQSWALREMVSAKTDSSGNCTIAPQESNQRFMAVAIGDAGYAQVGPFTGGTSQTIELKLEPFIDTVKGTLQTRTPMLPNQTIILNRQDAGTDGSMPSIFFAYQTTADAKGNFEIHHVAPGSYSLGRLTPVGSRSSSVSSDGIINITAENTTFKIVADGRTVRGKIELPDTMQDQTDLSRSQVSISSDLPMPAMPAMPKWPADMLLMTPEQRKAWADKFAQTDEVKAFIEAQKKATLGRHNYFAELRRDGTFEVQNIVPGAYRVQVSVFSPADNTGRSQSIGEASQTFSVKETDGDAVDLPAMLIKLIPHLSAGDTAPDFAFTLADGKPAKLTDFSGKLVLVHTFFGITDSTDQQLKTNELILDAHRTENYIVVLSVARDEYKDAYLKYAAVHHMDSTLAFIDIEHGEQMSKQYGWSGRPAPEYMLIGADGRFISTALTADQIADAVERALKK